jgi:hypothetical protein
MKMKDSDINHLRRLLGFVRCEIGQAPDDMVAMVQSILPRIGEVSDEGKDRMVRSYLKSAAIPQYVRAAIKALEKVVSEQSKRSNNVGGRARGSCTEALPGCSGTTRRLLARSQANPGEKHG